MPLLDYIFSRGRHASGSQAPRISQEEWESPSNDRYGVDRGNNPKTLGTMIARAKPSPDYEVALYEAQQSHNPGPSYFAFVAYFNPNYGDIVQESLKTNSKARARAYYEEKVAQYKGRKKPRGFTE